MSPPHLIGPRACQLLGASTDQHGLSAKPLKQTLKLTAFLSSRLVVDFMRKGSVISWVATELGWVGLLWVLWLGMPTFLIDLAPKFDIISQ